MDALTHAVEAYIGNSTTPGTRKNALDAVQLIFENLDRAYTNGSDKEARKNMLRASYFAGCAFTKSYVGYVHAVAHTLVASIMFLMDLQMQYFFHLYWNHMGIRFIPNSPDLP